jgi:very-short-patch-repair endonuclease
MDYKQWLEENQDKLANDWERLFVEKVLTRVTDLDWQFLEAQKPFRDGVGQRRFVDFFIAEGDHVRIALEVDGFDKKGRGHGMNYKEFVDWQRRQNSLVDQGWSILRFANRDVKSAPSLCAEHITLLLRKQRHQMAHHEKTHRLILEKEKEIEAASQKVADSEEKERGYGADLDNERKRTKAARRRQVELEKELETLRRRMELAERAPALDEKQSQRLEELSRKQKKRLREQEDELEALRQRVQQQEKDIRKGEGEQDKMRTAIWAFAVVVIAAMVMLVYVTAGRDHAPVQTVAESQPATVALGASCENPVEWNRAGDFTGRRAAVSGSIAGISFRPDSAGQPTWINIGADFPDRSRFVAVVWGRNRSALSRTLDGLSTGDRICIIGKIGEYRGIPQIEVENSSQIRRL